MNVNEYDLIFTELGYLTHYSRMTSVIYRLALLVALNRNKLYVKSSPGHVHPNLNVLVQHKLPRRRNLRISNDEYIVDFNIRM